MRTSRRSSGVVAVGLSLALAGCAGGPAGPGSLGGSEGTPASHASGAVLQRTIDELAAMPGGPPGVAVVVQAGRSREFYSGGVARIGGRAPRITDHMRVASVAKAFSGATALVLIDKGVLRLTDTIGKWLPELPVAWHRVTLRQLLSHTSGVPDFVRTEAFAEFYSNAPDDPPSPITLLGFAPTALDFPAGAAYAYSNSDNIVVGLMIEAATSRPYEKVLGRRVLAPLGLSRTSLPRTAVIPGPFIHGYALDQDHPRPQDVSDGLAGGWAWASGGVVSTPANLNRFIRAYVGGRLISSSLKRTWQRLFIPDAGSEPPGPGFNSASMALFRYETTCGTVYGHSGNTVGYTQYAVATADGSRSAVVTINLQRTHHDTDQGAKVFAGLQRVVQAAICSAMR
jgi:D-alanyl-D-alanine carboxypeptidase